MKERKCGLCWQCLLLVVLNNSVWLVLDLWNWSTDAEKAKGHIDFPWNIIFVRWVLQFFKRCISQTSYSFIPGWQGACLLSSPSVTLSWCSLTGILQVLMPKERASGKSFTGSKSVAQTCCRLLQLTYAWSNQTRGHTQLHRRWRWTMSPCHQKYHKSSWSADT